MLHFNEISKPKLNLNKAYKIVNKRTKHKSILNSKLSNYLITYWKYFERF